jgi:hypothetical protein
VVCSAGWVNHKLAASAARREMSHTSRRRLGVCVCVPKVTWQNLAVFVENLKFRLLKLFFC